ncbi:MAG: serine/threonine-protein kinase [Planctomycetota bacterium]
MSDQPLQPGALDRLAREVGKERTKSAAGAAPAFGWVPGSGAPAMIGRFRIVAPLGRGGMGVVYHAIDSANDAPVALKSLTAGPGERLKREGEAIGLLDHPGIVKILETGEEAGKPFLVMELVNGKTLDEAWAGWDLRTRVEALEKIARAVAHAHERGVAHRDLKPANVLVAEDGAPRVTDFGLAAVEEARTKLTDPGSVMGTPAWMSPEQVRGETAGPPADVHALGAILYLAMTGTAPFDGPNPPAIYRRIVDEEAPWPRRKTPGAPAALEAICVRAMGKVPVRRPSANEFGDELKRWLQGEPVLSRLPSVTVRVWKRARRNPLAWVGLAAAVVALAAGASALAVQGARHATKERARDLARDAQPLAAQALLALSAGDDASAARLMADFRSKMEEARALDPAAAGGWFEIAEYLRLTGDEDGAMRIVQEGEALHRNHPLLLLERGLLLMAELRRIKRRADIEAEASARAGGPREASRSLAIQVPEMGTVVSDILARAIRDLGGSAPPSARIARAELALLQSHPEEAWTLVEGLEPPEAKVVAGQVKEARGNLEEALAWYSKAIATRDRHWPAWEARAAARERFASMRWRPGAEDGESEQADAIADWKRLAAALPRRADIHLSLSAALCRLGQMRIYRRDNPTEPCQLALQAAEDALEIAPASGEARLAAGRALAEIADWRFYHDPDPLPAYARAIAELEAATQALPRSFEARLALARTFRMRGFWKRVHGGPPAGEDDERALNEFEEVLGISPVWLAARCNQGLILFELGRFKEAVGAFEQGGSWTTNSESTLRVFEEAKKRAAE